MMSLGIPELFVLLMALFVYVLIVPAVLCVALRLLVWFAERIGLAEAFGSFGVKVADSFRAAKAPAE